MAGVIAHLLLGRVRVVQLRLLGRGERRNLPGGRDEYLGSGSGRLGSGSLGRSRRLGRARATGRPLRGGGRGGFGSGGGGGGHRGGFGGGGRSRFGGGWSGLGSLGSGLGSLGSRLGCLGSGLGRGGGGFLGLLGEDRRRGGEEQDQGPATHETSGKRANTSRGAGARGRPPLPPSGHHFPPSRYRDTHDWCKRGRTLLLGPPRCLSETISGRFWSLALAPSSSARRSSSITRGPRPPRRCVKRASRSSS